MRTRGSTASVRPRVFRREVSPDRPRVLHGRNEEPDDHAGRPRLGRVRYELVAPVLDRTLIDQHVSAVALGDLEAWRVRLEATVAGASVAGDQHPIAGIEPPSRHGQVVPVRRMPGTVAPRKRSSHSHSLPDGGSGVPDVRLVARVDAQSARANSQDVRVTSQADDRPWLRQDVGTVRFDWGPSAVEQVRADAVVVVDILRFTTAVDAGVARGAAVVPCRWKDAGARQLADEMSAILADPGDALGPSLSPVSLLSLRPGDRIVLPSPNGSTCAAIAADLGATVVAACLRNAGAVATWLNQTATTVTVIACGERWPDGSLRPSLEDYLGGGAVIAGLHGVRSPEAEAAAGAWVAARPTITEVVSASVSGRELRERGWERDLEFALDVGASTAVPVLRDGAFIDACLES